MNTKKKTPLVKFVCLFKSTNSAKKKGNEKRSEVSKRAIAGGLICLIISVIAILFLLFSLIKEEENTKEKIEWSYCWWETGAENPQDGEGDAFNLKFDENGEILSFQVKWGKGETKYSRPSAKETGTYSHNEKKAGTWSLFKLSNPSEHGGWEKPSKGERREAYLFTPTPQKEEVDLVQIQKELGSEWEMIEMTKGKEYGPYPIKNGSSWKVVEGEVWTKIDDNIAFLEKPNCNMMVGGRKVKFSPETTSAILFFKK